MMSPYLPDAHACPGLAGTFAALLAFTVLGAVVTTRGSLLEFQPIAGRGLACVILTIWGVSTPASLRIPAAALGAATLACLIAPSVRKRIGIRGGERSPARSGFQTVRCRAGMQ
jgi:hypothetical protein